MKQTKLFKSGISTLFMGATFLMLFGMFACNNPNTGNSGEEKLKVTFGVDGVGGSLKAKVKGESTYATDGAKGVEVEKGKKITFTAEPEQNYKVKMWLDGMQDVTAQATGTDKVTFVLTVSKATAIKVKFESTGGKGAETVKVKFSVDGDGGAIEAEIVETKETLTNGADGADVPKGKNVKFTAKPNAQYEVEKWIKDNKDVLNEKRVEYIVSNIQANTEVKVKFKQKTVETVKVKFSVDGDGGAIEAEIVETKETLTNGADGADVPKGKNVKFTAKPDAQHEVEKWIKDNQDVPNEKGVEYIVSNIQATTEVKVKFKQKTVEKVKVKFSVDGTTGGTIEAEIVEPKQALTSGTDGADVPKGKNVKFTAKPDAQHEVEKWIKDNQDVPNEKGVEYIVSNIQAATDVKVKFKAKSNRLETVTIGAVSGKLAKGNENEDGKRSPAFDITYPKFLASEHTGKHIGFYIALKGDKKFKNGTEIKLTYQLTPKGASAETAITGTYTVSTEDKNKIFDHEFTPTLRAMLADKYSEAKENFAFAITLGQEATDDLEVKVVKAIFDAATEETGKVELGNKEFTIKGYGK
ncbi:MAG: InlB B-repeat-containing protein [Treponema sp.]